jgi:hypothetical protein
MKKHLLMGVLTLCITSLLQAQVILFQDFNNGANPGWVTSNGASVGSYEDTDAACAQEYGIITPGVGGNNPAKILSQIITPNQQVVEVKFSIYRYNANLSCNSRSNFACPTSVDILAVASTYTGTDPVGDGAVIYSNNSGFLLPITGGIVSMNITLPNASTPFKVFFNFTTNNCNQPGTKYVLDKFSFTGLPPCGFTNNCPPVANDDFFKATTQGFESSELKANVFGTNLGYFPTGLHSTLVTRSLTNGVLSPQGGNDFDIDNHPQNLMSWTLLSQDFTALEATFTFNTDGTFTFTRLDVNRDLYHFTYRLTDPNGNFDDATVTIDYGGSITLPVRLTSFYARKTAGGRVLSWETAQEVNNRGFEIERKANGAFVRIATIASLAPNGNSNTPLQYSYTDREALSSATVQYRLKQTDLNGRETYSEIRSLRLDELAQPMLVYPNPSAGEVTVLLPENQGLVDVIITDQQGRIVKQIRKTSAQNFRFSGLQTGIYLVKVTDEVYGARFVQKLVVK